MLHNLKDLRKPVPDNKITPTLKRRYEESLKTLETIGESSDDLTLEVNMLNQEITALKESVSDLQEENQSLQEKLTSSTSNQSNNDLNKRLTKIESLLITNLSSNKTYAKVTSSNIPTAKIPQNRNSQRQSQKPSNQGTILLKSD